MKLNKGKGTVKVKKVKWSNLKVNGPWWKSWTMHKNFRDCVYCTVRQRLFARAWVIKWMEEAEGEEDGVLCAFFLQLLNGRRNVYINQGYKCM